MTSHFVLIDFLDTRRSGMALATERRINMLAAESADVTVISLDLQPDHADVISALRDRGRLHDKVAVINFYAYWFDAAAPVPAAADPELLLDEPGFRHYPDVQRGTANQRYYDDTGRYAKYKAFDAEQRLVFVDYQSDNLQRTHRVEYNSDGRRIRETRFNLQTNKPAFERYFDRAGGCFLSVWVNGSGQRTKSVLHPRGLGAETLDDIYVAWTNEQLAAAAAETVVMLDELRLLPVFRQLSAARKVITLHNSHLEKPYVKGATVRRVYREIFDDASSYDAIVFLTEQQKVDVEELLDGPRDNFWVIPHAVPEPAESDTEPAPERHAHSAITLARMEDSKNIADAIRAFRIVADELPDAAYHVYGYGSKRSELNALVHELSLESNVFVHDFIDSVDDELRRHACSVMTSRFEGFCLAILESLGNATPALSYRVKYGPEELVQHDVNGYLVEPGNYRQLAAYLLRVFGNLDLQQRLSAGCRTVHQTYSPAAFRERWLALFDELGGNGPDRSATSGDPSPPPPAEDDAPTLAAPENVAPDNAAPKATLDEIGLRAGIDQSSAGHDYLTTYQRELEAVRPDSIVIISGHQTDQVGRVFAEHFDQTQVHLLGVRTPPGPTDLPNLRTAFCPTVADLSRYLLGIPAPDALVEDGTNASSHKVRCFRGLFQHLRDGGLYLVEDLHAHQLERFRDEDEGVWQYIEKLLAIRGRPDPSVIPDGVHRDDVERANAVARVTSYGKMAVVQRQGTHLVKVKDEVLTEVLTSRLGAGRAREIFARPSQLFAPRCRLWVSRERTSNRFHPTVSIPELRARVYDDVVCGPRQLVLVDDVVPSVAFHHPLGQRLKNKSTVDVGPEITRLRRPLGHPLELRGIYYHLDSEFPGHFGHVMTEDLGRLWGWREAKEQYPELRLLLSTEQKGGRPKDFQRSLLHAYGINDDDIVCIDRPVRVDHLVGVSPMFHNGKYVHPELTQVWATIGSRLVPDPGPSERSIFVSRPPDLQRSCRNGPEVEAVFRDAGFEVVRPELLTIADQARLFAEARVVAGYGGSGLFGSIFARRPGVRIVIGSETYNATNEWLIAGVQGGEYHHFYGRADLAHPKEGWSVEAFHSDFTFDFARHGSALKKLLKRL